MSPPFGAGSRSHSIRFVGRAAKNALSGVMHYSSASTSFVSAPSWVIVPLTLSFSAASIRTGSSGQHAIAGANTEGDCAGVPPSSLHVARSFQPESELLQLQHDHRFGRQGGGEAAGSNSSFGKPSRLEGL
jgi:hypothetical protein